MAVPPHMVRASAALAINESTRQELVDFGSANLRSENIRTFQQGEAGPRYGFQFMPTGRFGGTTPTTGYKLFADGLRALRITDTLNAEAYSPQAGAWQSTGRVSAADYTLTSVANSGPNTTAEDIEYCNGYFSVLSGDNTTTTGGTLTMVDATTFAEVYPPSPFAHGVLASFSNRYIVALWANGLDFSLYIMDTLSAATVASGFTALSDAGVASWTPGQPFAIVSLTDRFALAYVNNSVGTDRITVKTFNASGLLQTTTVNTSSIKPDFIDIACFQGTGTLWVAWNEGVSVKMQGLNAATITTVQATTATIITIITAAGQTTAAELLSISPSSATAGRLIVNEPNSASAGLHMREYTTVAGAAATNGAQTDIYGAMHCSRPFYYGGRHYVQAFGACDPNSSTEPNTQQTTMLVDFTDDYLALSPVVAFAPSLAVTSLSSRSKTVAGPSATQMFGVTSLQRAAGSNACFVVTYDFASSRRWQTASMGGATFLSGGILAYYDGVRIAESGFMHRPFKPAPSNLTTAGVITGTYRYVAVFEVVDADGNWIQSGLSTPSDPITVTSKRIGVVTRPISITQRLLTVTSTTCRIAWYRTTNGGNAPYYRVGSSTNSLTAGTSGILDNVTDPALILNAVLYSQPGVLGTSQDKRPPPGLGIIASYNGMLVGAEGSNVWYSAQNVIGEGAWFNPIFQVPVPGDGDITALAVMDGTLFVFKRREVYTIAGDPPSDNGASGGLGFPRKLAVDVGCIESRSTCTTALGIFFQSDRGIEILTRAQSVQWIGQPVQQTLAAFPVVTSVTLQPTKYGAYVLVECAATQTNGRATGQGRTLVYDLSLNAWISTDIRESAVGTVAAPSQSACMIYTGSAWRYAWLGTTGYVHYEDPTTYLDADSSFVVALLETGWYNASAQEQAVETGTICFQRYTAAGIKVETAYDYADYDGGQEAVATWTEDDTLGERELEWDPKVRGEAVKFRITTTPPAPLVLGNGHAMGFISLSLTLGPKQGPVNRTMRLDPAKRR